MINQYNYENGIQIKIWEEEIPKQYCLPVKTIEKIYDTESKSLGRNRLMAVELKVPRNTSNYAMLGVQYENSSQTQVEIDIYDYDYDYDTSEFIGNLGLKPDYIQFGIPEDYVKGIFKSIEHLVNLGTLKKGKYRFFVGAHGEVGSSVNSFATTCTILVKIIYLKEVNKEIVESVINSAII